LHNPNLLGMYLALVIPFILVPIFYEKKIKYKIYFSVSLAIMLAALALTYSRGAMIAVAVSILAFVAFYSLKYFLIVLLISPLSIFVVPDNIITRIKSLSLKDSTIFYRVKIWKNAKNMIFKKPIIGIGYGKENFAKEYLNYMVDTKPVSHTHNTFIQILVENGIVGFITFVALIVAAIRYLIITIYNIDDKYKKIFSIATLSMIIGFIFLSIGEDVLYYYKNIMMFFILLIVGSTNINNIKKD